MFLTKAVLEIIICPVAT